MDQSLNTVVLQTPYVLFLGEETNPLKAKTAPVLLGTPQYLSLPGRREAATAALSQAWSALLPRSIISAPSA